MIGKIGGIQGGFPKDGSTPISKPNVANIDRLEISEEAKNRVQSEKIAGIKARLDSYMKNGEIDSHVLDKMAENIFNEFTQDS